MARSVDLRPLASELGAEAKSAALDAVRSILTEENTDALIFAVDMKIKGALPIWLKWLPVGMVLDKLLPGILLDVFEEVLG